MNTLQDLRHTLDQHAATVHGDLSHARVAAVRGRARKVRRQRAAGVGVAAVLAVAAASVVPMLGPDRTPVPADRRIIGKVAPATLTSLGYTYHFKEAFSSSDQPAAMRLGASDEPRLVTWASASDHVWLHSSMQNTSTESAANDFDDFVAVPPGASPRFKLRTNSDGALAVYELGDEAPAGYTVDGITFRQQVADDTLLAARIAQEGETSASVEVTLPKGEVRLAGLCQGEIPKGYWFNIEIADQGAVSSTGCEDGGFDPGAGGYPMHVRADEAGDTVPVRAWVSRGAEGPAVALDDVRVGLGVYDASPPARTLAGSDVPRLMEYAGHLWRYRSAQSVIFADHSRLGAVNRLGEQVLLVGSWRGMGRAMVLYRYGDDGIFGENFRNSDGVGGGVSVLLSPGAAASLTVQRGAPDGAELGWATYVRAD